MSMTQLLPPNVVVRERYWYAQRNYASPSRWRVTVYRQRYQDLLVHFGLGGLIHRWWSWCLLVQVGHQTFTLWRMREKVVA